MNKRIAHPHIGKGNDKGRKMPGHFIPVSFTKRN